LDLPADVLEERTVTVDRERAAAVFPLDARHHFAPEQQPDQLKAITYSEHRHAQFEHLDFGSRRTDRQHATRPPGQNDPDHPVGPQLLRRRVEAVDPRINLTLPQPPGDHLRILGTEIENCYDLWHGKRTTQSAHSGERKPGP